MYGHLNMLIVYPFFTQSPHAVFRQALTFLSIADITNHATSLSAQEVIVMDFHSDRIDLKALHKVQVGILHELDRVCKKNGIRYYLAYGTLIGAIRHNGIIPWDDDIDVVVSRSDYEKLMELPASEWQEPFFLQSEKTSPNACKCFMKLKNSNTTLIEKENQHRDINHGISIDIYPLVNLADDPAKRKAQMRYALAYMLFVENHPARNHGTFYKMASAMVLGVLPSFAKNRIKRFCERKMLAYQNVSTEDCFALSGLAGLVAVKNRYFQEAIPHAFEDGMFTIPSGYHEWLTTDYGENYMTPPPESERGVKLDNFVLVDTEHSYKIYKNKYYFVKD